MTLAAWTCKGASSSPSTMCKSSESSTSSWPSAETWRQLTPREAAQTRESCRGSTFNVDSYLRSRKSKAHIVQFLIGPNHSDFQKRDSDFQKRVSCSFATVKMSYKPPAFQTKSHLVGYFFSSHETKLSLHCGQVANYIGVLMDLSVK